MARAVNNGAGEGFKEKEITGALTHQNSSDRGVHATGHGADHLILVSDLHWRQFET